MSAIIQSLQSSQLLWRAGEAAEKSGNTLSSGYPQLDGKLGGGWPDKGIVELQTQQTGIGEVRLLLPSLKTIKLRQENQDRLFLWVRPPGRLNAQTLSMAGLPLNNTVVATDICPEQGFWIAEQSLRSGCCAVVVMWCESLEPNQAKRLQLAAKEGDSLGVLIRPPSDVEQSLPISLRMSLSPNKHGLAVDINKRLGGNPVGTFALDMTRQWPLLTEPKPVVSLMPKSH